MDICDICNNHKCLEHNLDNYGDCECFMIDPKELIDILNKLKGD